MKKTQDDMSTILEYLNQGPKNLTSFEYKDWDDEVTEKVMSVIRNTVPEQRIVNEIVSGVSNTPSKSASAPKPKSESADSYYEQVSQTKVSNKPEREASPAKSSGSSSSLDDLYNDL